MKKFFSRFNGSAGLPSVQQVQAPGLDAAAVTNEKSAGRDVANSAAPSPAPRPVPLSPAKERVRAMTARFEELNGAGVDAKPAQRPAPSAPPPPSATAQVLAPKSASVLNSTLPAQPTASAPAPAPAKAAPQTSSPRIGDADRGTRGRGSKQGSPNLDKDLPRPTLDGASPSARRESATEAQAQAGSKQVAFAASPVKPSAQRAERRSSTSSQTELSETVPQVHTPVDSPPGFARPTVSSTARAAARLSSSSAGLQDGFGSLAFGRPGSRAGSSAAAGARGSTDVVPTSASPAPAFAPAPQPMARSNSLNVPSGSSASASTSTPPVSGAYRKGSRGAPGPYAASHSHSYSASAAPASTPVSAPAIHLTYQDALAHLPAQSSIPFAGTYRSASPLPLSTSGSSPGTSLNKRHSATSSVLPPASTAGVKRRSSASGRTSGDEDSASILRSRTGSQGATDSRFGSLGARSIGTGMGAPSWSEMTQEELVVNLGSRERTRQEVLWEIVASEERYVLELEKIKGLYADALLHPMRFSPPATSPTTSPRESMHGAQQPMLPIALRFSSAQAESRDGRALRRADSGGPGGMAALSHSGSSGFARGLGIAMARDGPEEDPVARAVQSKRKTARRSNASLFGPAGVGSSQSGKPGEPFSLGLAVPLPESLRLVLESLSDGLLEAHELLSDALKARYEAQWPLVRSLADVFMRYSYLLQHYATYVCHLQRALEQIEEAMLMERAMRGKRIKKERLSQTVALGRTIAVLEAFAIDCGEPGLAIFICKPFQRLLKYPLLFQNLLFHTDPSTHEFESTVEMVVEVERIVRSIEDEKVSAEERDCVRDAFARIDGITDRRLLKPRGDRFLVEERSLFDEAPKRALSENAPGGLSSERRPTSTASDSEDASPAQQSLRSTLRSKRSYRRLSDFLVVDPKQKTKAPNLGSKKDIWIVKFSDVELRCQRVGVTALPMASSAVLRPDGADSEITDDADNLAARAKESKERLKALRSTTLRAKTRNLYKFIAVQSWKAAEKLEEAPPQDSLVEEAEEQTESDASSEGAIELDRYVRQSKLSFSYWGQDKVEPSARKHSPQLSSVRQQPGKFAGRLRDGAASATSSTAASRRTSVVNDSVDRSSSRELPLPVLADHPATLERAPRTSLISVPSGMPISASDLHFPSSET